MNIQRHCVQRDIRKVLRIEKEMKSYYGLHNLESFEKVKKLFKYIIVEPINEMTVRVVKYTDNEDIALEWSRNNPKLALIMEGVFII